MSNVTFKPGTEAENPFVPTPALVAATADGGEIAVFFDWENREVKGTLLYTKYEKGFGRTWYGSDDPKDFPRLEKYLPRTVPRKKNSNRYSENLQTSTTYTTQSSGKPPNSADSTQ